MNTAVTIVDTLSRTAVYLACIGAGLKIGLVVVPQFRIAAPKEPAQPKADAAAGAPKAAEPAAELKAVGI